MVKKKSRRVKTLSGFMKWAEQFDKGQYLFRGVSNEDYKIEASASRRLGENGNDPNKLLKVNKEMINEARLEGHDLKDGQRLSDLELLAELQHYGAATCLIDFTYSAQVALWMACQRESKRTTGRKVFNGKVFAVNISSPTRFQKVTSQSLGEDIDCFFVSDGRRGYPLYQWQPKQQNNRIIAQQSVFLFGGAKIEAEAECVILKNSKESILISLEKSGGISEARMFPDFDGFARLRAHDRIYVEPNVQSMLGRASELHKEGRLDDAITAYDAIISLQSNDLALASAYYNRANVHLEYADAIDLYIEDLSMAIQLKPDYVEAYFDRGFAYLLDKGEADLAKEDFTKLIQFEPNNAEAYCLRGISWLHLKNWKKAKADLETAQNMRFDIAFFFWDHCGTIEDFKERTGIELPEEIAAILSRE